MGSGAKGGVMPTKRFTIWNDGEKRRKKGLCFNCEKRFTLEHRCKAKLAILEDEEIKVAENVTDEDEPYHSPTDLSVHIVGGIQGSKTMRILRPELD